ncbi:uncharacterized protein [Populus alba]|nr:uncharacterized protein LOC118027477 [Populus alba]
MRHKHKKSFITVILCSNGALTTSIDEVNVAFVHYYHNLLRTSSSVSPIDVVVVHSGPCLDESHYSFLLVPVSNEIVKENLFSIGNDKAPGLNGYSSLVFKKSWDIVRADFCVALQDFFSFGQILKQINHSIIAQVLKSANVNSTNDFRSISCCNVLRGRNIIDNINLAQEFLRHYDRKRTFPCCLIKIEFKKAFDSVQWVFLRELLHLLGFPYHFVHLVMLYVETSSFSVAINDSLYGFFPRRCGVR